MVLPKDYVLARIPLWLTSALVFLLVGCGNNASSEGVFIPMQVGQQWHYEVEGNVEAKQTTIHVRERFDASGTTWFGVEPLLGDFNLIRNTEQGVVYSIDCSPYDFDECVDELGQPKEGILYKSPSERGESYGYLDWPETAVTVLGDQQLTVPAGTFSCTLYEFNLGRDVTRHCVSRGVGLIWIQETWSTADGRIPVVLKRISI